MKKAILILSFIALAAACKNTPPQEDNSLILDEGAYAKSAGRINSLTVVMDNDLWQGQVGETIREKLATSVPGLPQEEPLFNIKQMSSSAFSGFARKSRNFLKIETSKPINYKTYTNKYARPQLGIEINGYTDKEVIKNFLKHYNEIVSAYKSNELKYKQSFFKKTLKIDDLNTKMGYSLKIPRAYRLAKQTNDFYWIRKDITHGSMNLILYSVPLNSFVDSLSTIQNIIKIRDKVGGDQIVVDEGGRFITEAAYSPYLKNVSIKKVKAFETKGTWEVKNKYMAGPFINYTIKDKEKNRYLVLEGFVFAPSINKRDYMFELESIIKTIEFE